MADEINIGIIRGSEITPREIEWLWYPYIPFGKLTLLQGDPGEGKSTFATRCIEADVPAVVLKKWMGHTDIHVTLDTYADVFDSMKNNAINKFQDHMETLSI